MTDDKLERGLELKAEIEKLEKDLAFLGVLQTQWSAAVPDPLVSSRLELFFQRSGKYLETLTYTVPSDFTVQLNSFVDDMILRTSTLIDTRQQEYDNLCLV